MSETEKQHRGGKRAGAGRPKGESKLYSFRAPGPLARILDAQKDRTAFICNHLKQSVATRDLGSQHLEPRSTDRRNLDPRSIEPQSIVPASRIAPVSVPFFDISLVAGFPIPLDNDERSQDIDMLRLLCPHPESSYLIRVQGESMIDAGISSGDIVIVDKSRRTPAARDIAVCELNGEYTVKRVCEEDGQVWLVPANPDYPRIPVSEGDAFSVWGIVTYIIHKARD